EPTRELARASALMGIPVAELLDLHRLATSIAWEHFVRFGREIAGRDIEPEELLVGTSRLWEVTNRYMTVISEAYDDTAAERIRTVERERAALVDALFEGHSTGDPGPGDAAHRLGLPHRGDFVAVVAEVAPRTVRIDDLEHELRSGGIASV